MRESFAFATLSALCVLIACGGGSSAPSQVQQRTPPLAITSGTPVAGITGTAYGSGGNGFILSASGGVAPYTWSWAAASGSSLPPGLNLSGNVISGTPNTSGSFNVTVTVSDSASPVAEVSTNYTISVTAGPLTITSGNPPAGQVGSAYGNLHILQTSSGPLTARYFQFAATGGSGALTWDWIAAQGSSLPPGLGCCNRIFGSVFAGHGVLVRGEISGIPTVPPGSYSVTVTVSDSSTPAQQASASYTISIAPPPPPVVSATPLPPIGTLNSPYPSFAFTATSAAAPVSWAETGALPPGMNPFGSDGVLSGTPTAAGSFPISVTATDSLGQSSSPQNFAIQVLSQGFAPASSMASARAWHTATLLASGKVVVIGGYDGSNDLASAELFDPTAKTFSATGSLATTRHSHTATLLQDGRVLIAGGLSAGTAIAGAEIYDPNTGTFTATGNLNTARASHTATLLNNGKVLITGGLDATGVPSATVEVFDPSAGTFTSLTAMADARDYQTATLLNDGKVLVSGGQDAAGNALASTILFDPTAQSFANVGSLITPRLQHTATLLNDGRVLMSGGIASGGGTNTAELYDPMAQTFAATGTMGVPQSLHTATLLNNGQVLISGGQDVNLTPISTAELFDPSTGTFAATADLTSARSAHTATLLNNGEVLVTGGFDAAQSPLSTAELYH